MVWGLICRDRFKCTVVNVWHSTLKALPWYVWGFHAFIYHSVYVLAVCMVPHIACITTYGPRSRVLSMCHRGSCCPCCLKGALDLTQYHAVGEVWSCMPVDCHEAPCPLISAGACSDCVLGGPWPLCSQQPFVLLVLAMISLPRVCSGLLLYHCDWWSLSITDKGLSVTFWSWKQQKLTNFDVETCHFRWPPLTMKNKMAA